MAGTLHGGPRTLSMTVDDDGYRTYRIAFLVLAELGDGPAAVLQTAGLPQPGDPWVVDDDIDLWTWFRPATEINIHQEKEGDPAVWWNVVRTASNKPPQTQRCQDVPIEDPLLEPPKISGSFVRAVEEATVDRFGSPIVNSAHEQIRGPQVEFDAGRDTIRIEQNVATIAQAFVIPAVLMNVLNDVPLWGFPARCVKLSSRTFDKRYHGKCHVYYNRVLEFETNAKYDPDGNIVSGFDRDILDEGTKVLNGHWDSTTGNWSLDNIGGAAPDPGNPTHFIRAKDKNGENTTFILNGHGVPIDAKVTGAITGASNADPIVITSTAHGLSTGNTVAVAGVEGNEAANGVWLITVLTADTFSLDGSEGDGAYTAGTGLWRNLGANGAGTNHVEKYQEADLATLLGLPTVL